MFWHIARVRSIAMEFRRFRQLQSAYLANDTVAFAAAQAMLNKEMLELHQASSIMLDSVREAELFNVIVNVTSYPGLAKKIPQQQSVFLATMEYFYAGLDIAALPFSSFATIQTNNQFNYVLNNYANIQAEAFEGQVLTDLFQIQSSSSYIVNVSTILMSVVKAVLSVSLLGWFLKILFGFLDKQRRIFNLFLKIPKRLAKEQLLFWEEAAEQDLLGLGDQTDKKNARRKSLIAGKIGLIAQVVVFGAILICLDALLVANTANVNFVLVVLFGQTQAYSFRSVTLAKELYQFDNYTWTSFSYLNQTFQNNVNIYYAYNDGLESIKQLDSIMDPDVRDGWDLAINTVVNSTETAIGTAILINVLLLSLEFVLLVAMEYFIFWRSIWFAKSIDESAIELIVHMPPDIKRDPHFIAALNPLLSNKKPRKRKGRTSIVWLYEVILCCGRKHKRNLKVHPDGHNDTLDDDSDDDDSEEIADSKAANKDLKKVVDQPAGFGKGAYRIESKEDLNKKIIDSREDLFEEDADNNIDDEDEYSSNAPSGRISEYPL
eukprot:jgi/Hompol1/2426/HPOL_002913-RA